MARRIECPNCGQPVELDESNIILTHHSAPPLRSVCMASRANATRLVAAIDKAVAAEREACAAIADDHARERRERMQKSAASWLEERAIAAEDIATEIRARSKGGAR